MTIKLIQIYLVIFCCVLNVDAQNATEIPPMPEGYSSNMAVKAAALTGMLKLIDADNVPVPDSVDFMEGLEYGKGGDVSMQLDLYLPKESKEPKPGLIFIHGGAWQKGKRSDYAFYCVKFAEKGYAVATISYRLSGVAPFPAALEDSKCAVRWMRANAENYGIDPERIAVIGGSAGGHLAMMVGYTPGQMEGTGGHSAQSSKPQVVVDIYGPTNLTTETAKEAGSVKKFLEGKSYDEAPELYVLASPITHLTKDAPPTLILHGTIDETVKIIQAEMLEEKLKELGVPYHYEKFPGWPHTMDLAQAVNDRCVYVMEQFFKKHLH